MITKDEMKKYTFYRISTDINGKIFLEFKNEQGNTIKLKHSVIKGTGISIYNDMTLYNLFQFNENGLKKYRINYL